MSQKYHTTVNTPKKIETHTQPDIEHRDEVAPFCRVRSDLKSQAGGVVPFYQTSF